jgi:hypothetical protein
MILDLNRQFFGDYISATAEIVLLRQYIGRMDVSLADAQGACATSVRTIPEAAEMIAADEADLICRADSEILNVGFVISVAIFLEKQLREYTDALRQAENLGLGLQDISGSLPERFRKYCLHIARLPALTSQTTWQDICGFMDIRNCLVHKDGRLDGFGKADAVREFVRRHGTPEIQDGVLVVTSKTSHKCLDIVNEFIKAAYHVALDKYKPRIGRRNSNKAEAGDA